MAKARKRKKSSGAAGVLDVSGIKLTPAASVALNLVLDSDKMSLVAQRAGGAWWVNVLGRTQDRSGMGVRLIPDVAQGDSPVVLVCGADVVTVSSRPLNAVTTMVFRHVVQGSEQWQQVATALTGMNEDDHASIAALQVLLGGEAGMGILEALILNPTLRAACVDHDDPVTRAAAICGIMVALDPTVESRAYWMAMQDMLAGHLPERLPEVGCWRQALAAQVVAASRRKGVKVPPKALCDASWTLLRGSPGLDTCVLDESFPLLAPSPEGYGEILIHAARALLSERKVLPPVVTRDPLWQVVETLPATADAAKAGGSSAALCETYMRAAVVLEEAGDPARAFQALQGAAFWYRTHEGGFLAAPLEAATKLADRSGWADVKAVLERLLLA